jgi:hypothetical protein
MPPSAAAAGSAARLNSAVVYLAADLHPDDEEEDHHQAVVDDPLEGPLEREPADADAEGRVPEMHVALSPRRVRPRESDSRRDEQQDAAGGLDAEEALERPAGQARESEKRLPGLGR